MSPDGRFVLFSSDARDLIPGQNQRCGFADQCAESYIRDRAKNTTERALSGEATGRAHGFGITADGRYVVFGSDATDLVPGDTNGLPDVFVRDRSAQITERVSISTTGEQADKHNFGASISDDGRFVVFESDATNLVPGSATRSLYLRDRHQGVTQRLTETNGEQSVSFSPRITPDGHYVAFMQSPSAFFMELDVYVHDLATGITELVSVDAAGERGNAGSMGSAISDDGRFVAFESSASNLVQNDSNGTNDAFVHERVPGGSALPQGGARQAARAISWAVLLPLGGFAIMTGLWLTLRSTRR